MKTRLVLLGLAIPRLAYAVPIVVADSISSPAVVNNAGSVGVLGPSTTAGYQALATSFTTGTNASTLLQVDAVITFLAGNSADGTGTNLTVSIFSDAASAPGTFLGALTFTPPPNLNRFGFGTTAGIFLPGSPLALAPTTTYWVVAEALSDASYTWNYSSSGPTAVTALSPGVWGPSSYLLATRVTVDAPAPELGAGNAQLPLLFAAILLGLGRRRVHQEI